MGKEHLPRPGDVVPLSPRPPSVGLGSCDIHSWTGVLFCAPAPVYTHFPKADFHLLPESGRGFAGCPAAQGEPSESARALWDSGPGKAP